MRLISRIKIAVVNIFPFTSGISRFVKAILHAAAGQKKSYSQHGEDVFIWELLNKELPGVQHKYIDVGGFHPTLISNTYLMYRKNMSGVVVEPNSELAGLHRTFRPRDIQLQVACSNVNRISKFYLQKTFPALSSLNNAETPKKIKCEYVPVFTLDAIYDSVDFTNISFLSVDVEGYDFEVLQGGEKTLRNTFLVCIECDNTEMEEKIKSFLGERGFTYLKRFECNLIFKNEKFSGAGN